MGRIECDLLVLAILSLTLTYTHTYFLIYIEIRSFSCWLVVYLGEMYIGLYTNVSCMVFFSFILPVVFFLFVKFRLSLSRYVSQWLWYYICNCNHTFADCCTYTHIWISFFLKTFFVGIIQLIYSFIVGFTCSKFVDHTNEIHIVLEIFPFTLKLWCDLQSTNQSLNQLFLPTKCLLLVLFFFPFL